MPNADRTRFGVTPDGEVVERVTLRNGGGMQVDVITLGASLQGVQVPDREGRIGHVLLGHDTLEPYVRQPHFMGACVGRYANRIGGAAFTLDGRTFRITANEGANALHGGVRGLDKVVWRIVSADPHQVVLRHVSPDGDQGFPGELTHHRQLSAGPGGRPAGPHSGGRHRCADRGVASAPRLFQSGWRRQRPRRDGSPSDPRRLRLYAGG